MNNLLQEGIAAAKAGDKARAFQLLRRAAQDATMAEQAWLWLSAVVEQDAERLFCLDNVLRVNPGNTAAQQGAAMLRQKGILPAVPPGPSAPAPVPSPQASMTPAAEAPPAQPAPAPASHPQSPAPPAGPAKEQMAQETSGLVKFAAQELGRKTPLQVVVQNLIRQGASPETAASIVAQTHQALQKARHEKYRKQMVRGLLWTIAGIVVTGVTYLFPAILGGNFLICWGAVILGIIDLLVGIIGWLSTR